ncbi:hypothetical protein RAS1_37160 [Phycisphaerae bacterium RAS1]|nr:hypothetical protein RAS1_37160 [Phycisphaerae bacterium RAS1]
MTADSGGLAGPTRPNPPGQAAERRPPPRWRSSLPIVLLITALPSAAAHDFSITDVLAIFKSDETYCVDITCDLDALALGVGSEQQPAVLAEVLRNLPPEEQSQRAANLRALIEKRVRIRFDARPAEYAVSFPDPTLPPSAAASPTFLGVTARLSGRAPREAREVVIWLSRAFGPVRLTLVHQQHGVVVRQVLGPGEESRAFRLDVPLIDAASRPEVAWQYARLGFEHILPRGLDHILFVLALFLLSVRLRPLLWQVTAFTLAHTTTLALAMYGVFSLPPAVVEPLIAASIAYAAIENVLTAEMKPWRPALVFGFGLLHGMGFAGVLTALGVPRSEFVTALVSFNAGVELGQLAVILLALAIVGWWRRRRWYRAAIVIPASAAIAAVGLFWAVQRTFGL